MHSTCPHAAQRGPSFAARAQHQGDPTGSRTARQHRGTRHVMELTSERHRISAQQRHDDFQRLRVARHRPVRRIPELPSPTTCVTRAKPEHEPPARDLIERLSSRRSCPGCDATPTTPTYQHESWRYTPPPHPSSTDTPTTRADLTSSDCATRSRPPSTRCRPELLCTLCHRNDLKPRRLHPINQPLDHRKHQAESHTNTHHRIPPAPDNRTHARPTSPDAPFGANSRRLRLRRSDRCYALSVSIPGCRLSAGAAVSGLVVCGDEWQ